MYNYEKGSALIESLLTIPIFMSIIYGSQIFLSNSNRFTKDTMAELSLAQSINLFSQEELNNSNWAVVSDNSLENEINTLWNTNKLWDKNSTNKLDTASGISECQKKNIMYNELNKEKNREIDIKTCAEYDAYDNLSDIINKENQFIKINSKFAQRDLNISSIYRPNNMFDYPFRELISIDAYFGVKSTYKDKVSNTSIPKGLFPFNGGYFMQSEQIKEALEDVYFNTTTIQYLACLVEAEVKNSGGNPVAMVATFVFSTAANIIAEKNTLCSTTNSTIDVAFNSIKKVAEVRIVSLNAIEKLTKISMNIKNVESKYVKIDKLLK